VQLGIDCAILLASLAVLPPQNFVLSLLGAVVVNLISRSIIAPGDISECPEGCGRFALLKFPAPPSP